MEKGESITQSEKIDQSDYRIFTRNELVQYIKEMGETIPKEEK
jgi:hypothetical protein